MSAREITSNIVSTAAGYHMAILWFVLFSVNALCTSIVASMAGCVWGNLGTQEKFTIVMAIIGNWTGTIMAYISKSSKKIEPEENTEPKQP